MRERKRCAPAIARASRRTRPTATTWSTDRARRRSIWRSARARRTTSAPIPMSTCIWIAARARSPARTARLSRNSRARSLSCQTRWLTGVCHPCAGRSRPIDFAARGLRGFIMSAALRFFSLVLIVTALMLLGADVMTSLEKGEVTVRSLAQFWTTVDKASLDSFKVWLEHTLPAPVPGAVESFLNVYSWGPFGVRGVILAFAFSRHGNDDM